MNREELREATAEALQGCERLIEQLEESRSRVAALVPIDAAGLAQLPSLGWDPLYAFQMRFMLLQDLASRRLIRGFLGLSDEDPRNFSFREAVDRAAELGAITDGSRWLELTAVRNQLAHDYPVDLDQFALRLDDAWTRCDQLITDVHMLIGALRERKLI